MHVAAKLIVISLCLTSISTSFADSPPNSRGTFSFPNDPSVLNVKRDFGAKGDGKADDTEAIQRAIEASCGNDPAFRGKSNALFLPNGIYRVTKSLVVNTALGPWLYGESRDGVVIKLDDGVKGVTCVLRTHPREEGPTSADWFMRNLRHFTIDVGKNPETDGIRYYATNTGCLQDVRVVGHGKIGVNAGFLDQSGPNLIQDVEIEGFETGILSQWIWGQTLSRIKIKNCRKVGLEVSANVVAVEDLVVENTPLAVENKVPNGWHHWGGMLALVGGRFSGGQAGGPAILNHYGLYARDVTSTDFGQVLTSHTERGEVQGNRIEEYVAFPGGKLFDDAPEASLKLPIRREPVVPWEHDHSKWLCADEYGLNASDNDDDTDAIQAAFDAAAKEQKTVVYFRGCGGNEPNWIKLSRTIKVPRPVRMVLGLGWGRLMSDENKGGFVVDDDSADLVKFQNFDSFGGPPIQLTNASKNNSMILESCGVKIIGRGTGDIFITDCPASVELKTPGQKCWARHLNPEGDSNVGLVQNYGSQLWCLGVKHEGRGVRFSTQNGGQTEVLGLFNYGGYPDHKDKRPLFDVRNASFSVAALREIAFNQETAFVKVRERREQDERLLDKSTADGWIGWTLFSAHRGGKPK